MKLSGVLNVLAYFMGMAFNLAIVAVVAYAVWYFAVAGLEFGTEFATEMVYEAEYYTVEFELNHDTPAVEVARLLEQEGIITNQWLFRAEMMVLGSSDDYTAGTFTLNRSMSNREINRALRARPEQLAGHHVITIPEGWTVGDMAAYFESREFFDAEEFMFVANNGHFPHGFLFDVPNRENRLEGYLFPDTYFIPLNPTPGDIITRMLTRFEEIFFGDTDLTARAEEIGYTMDEIIIMASIIERETRIPRERALVSQVIHTRIDTGMRLEMCSTVAYVLDVPRARLLWVDLEIDSPFNTYRNPGLPLGPIANPGQAAIMAALHPSDTSYLFFVLINEESGEHYFSHTFDAHIAANQRVRG